MNPPLFPATLQFVFASMYNDCIEAMVVFGGPDSDHLFIYTFAQSEGQWTRWELDKDCPVPHGHRVVQDGHLVIVLGGTIRGDQAGGITNDIFVCDLKNHKVRRSATTVQCLSDAQQNVVAVSTTNPLRDSCLVHGYCRQHAQQIKLEIPTVLLTLVGLFVVHRRIHVVGCVWHQSVDIDDV